MKVVYVEKIGKYCAYFNGYDNTNGNYESTYSVLFDFKDILNGTFSVSRKVLTSEPDAAFLQKDMVFFPSWVDDHFVITYAYLDLNFVGGNFLVPVNSSAVYASRVPIVFGNNEDIFFLATEYVAVSLNETGKYIPNFVNNFRVPIYIKSN